MLIDVHKHNLTKYKASYEKRLFGQVDGQKTGACNFGKVQTSFCPALNFKMHIYVNGNTLEKMK